MKKTILIVIFNLGSTILLFSQFQFEQIIPPPPNPQIIVDLPSVTYSSIAFCDIDGDNDEDVLITGNLRGSQIKITKLFKNDGNGNYIEVFDIPFEAISGGYISFSDVDGDTDQDVLIVGEISEYEYIANLYINDGTGVFTEANETPFEGCINSCTAFCDIDGDNDQDLLMCGGTSENHYTKLYFNDGSGNFTEELNTPFLAIRNGFINFSDIDGDNDQDVMIMGWNNSSGRETKIYTNNGVGLFDEMLETPFHGTSNGEISFSDIDGDNDLDVIITGDCEAPGDWPRLYSNDGLGNFTEILDNPFMIPGNYTAKFIDVDEDNDPDLIISIDFYNDPDITELYLNDGMGDFVKMNNTPFDGAGSGSINISDIDGDGDQDVLIMGRNDEVFIIYRTKLYINEVGNDFSEVVGTFYNNIRIEKFSFADIDGDNDQDILICGDYFDNIGVTKLYKNDGNGFYSEIQETSFEGLIGSSIAFSDTDGDGDQDVIIAGRNSSNLRITKLFTNDGFGNFTEFPDTPFENVMDGSIAFSDVDGDNDQDVLITGSDEYNQPVSKLYINNGIGYFSELLNTPFDGVNYGSVAFSDVNGDNYEDLFLTGHSNYYGGVAKQYMNDGTGNFTEVFNTNFDPVHSSSIAFSDVDNDGDQDLMLTGESTSGNIAKLYYNDGSGNFPLVTDSPFTGVKNGSVGFSDMDGDNDQDILISGIDDSYSPNPIIKLYENNGLGNFAEVEQAPFDYNGFGNISFCDIDMDGDQDVLIGRSGYSNFTKLYRNLMTVNIIDLPVTQKINVYPNPTNGIIFIEQNECTSAINVILRSLDGKIIKKYNLSNQLSQKIRIDGDQGVYFLEILNDQYKTIYKVVKY